VGLRSLYDEWMGTQSVPGGLILGIESSCDETAAAVVRAGGEVLANVVASQIALHANYGGVVPELASREHLRNIVPVVRAAMAEAGIEFAELDAIAVTEGPGLAGALLVGITYAKALALGVGKPLIAVNHLEGHIHAVLMGRTGNREQGTGNREQGTGNREQGTGNSVGPMLALVVSGGHTHLYLAENPTHDDETVMSGAPGSWRYRNVGRTVDDAAGEAFDKVAKLLGLGYPGGPWMDALAKSGNPRAVEFRFGQIKPRRAVASTDEKQIPPLRCGMTNEISGGMTNEECGGMTDKKTVDGQHFDFSFSGIKTAVLRYIQTHGMAAGVETRRRALVEALKANPAMRPADAVREMPEVFDAQTLDLIASFQYAVVGNLMRQTFAAAEALGARGIVVSGGVSANSELRRRFAEEAAGRGLPVAFPTMAMSTDNAAMIAAAAWGKFVAGEFAVEGLVATPQLKLGEEASKEHYD
jgi:N6-L-threonylcarbamoyladenine synthase